MMHIEIVSQSKRSQPLYKIEHLTAEEYDRITLALHAMQGVPYQNLYEELYRMRLAR